VLVPYTSMGMDVASDMAVRSARPLVSFCTKVDAGSGLGATCQLYAGKIEADVVVEGDRAIFAVLSGSGDADGGRSGGAGVVETVENPVDLGDLAVECLGVAEPEAGDVDITTQDVLVVVGRGIESEDNIEEAQELADAVGGALAASRPIVDQGWLPKTRQVGKSGLTVKPKVYLTLGVSGAPEHVEGMKDAEVIISVNTDPQAPIFGVAHYGWVGDLFDLLPELTDRIESD
jgi:electron transfer flavoprotein alpha subunit